MKKEGETMKKVFKSYLAIWAVLLVLFNIVAFVSVTWDGQEKYTASFWVGYLAISIALIGQLIATYFALRSDDSKKTFYHIPMITISYTGLVLTFIFGGACMLHPSMPYWVGILLCAAVLAFTVIAVIETALAADLVNDTDEKIKKTTFFIKSLIVDAERLLTMAKKESIKTTCQKIYEAIRYSDPVSNAALASLESEITIYFAKLENAVETENEEQVKEVAEKLLILLKDRNQKCKLMK